MAFHVSSRAKVTDDANRPFRRPSGIVVERAGRAALSDMDVARAAMGQGWPFAASPRNNDEAREPRRSRGRMSGLDLLVTFGAMPKVTRSSERNRAHKQLGNAGPIVGMGYAYYFRGHGPLPQIITSLPNVAERPLAPLSCQNRRTWAERTGSQRNDLSGTAARRSCAACASAAS